MGCLVLTHWFKRRLGLALAIAFTGNSVCGCIYPVVIKILLRHTRYGDIEPFYASPLPDVHSSFPWTMRILAFISAGILIPTNLVRPSYLCPSSSAKSLILCQTAARRLPGTKDVGPLIKFSEFKKSVYSIYVASLLIGKLGLNAVSSSVSLTGGPSTRSPGIPSLFPVGYHVHRYQCR